MQLEVLIETGLRLLIATDEMLAQLLIEAAMEDIDETC
jgi:hypothetical protein